MKSWRAILTVAAITSSACLSAAGLAQTSSTPPAGHSPLQKTIGQSSRPKPAVVPSLIVFNARGASLQGRTLTLNGVSPTATIFADRPVRAAGHDLVSHLIEDWAAGSDSFGKNPPNATVSVLGKDGSTIHDAVVVLKSPKLVGDQLTFDVETLEGDLARAEGPASLFIDIIGLPWTPGSYAGWAHRTAYRAAWYSAVAHPYSNAALAAAQASAISAANGTPKRIGVPTTRRTIDALIVLNARGAKLAGETLVLEGAAPSAILFADRPVRAAGHLQTAELVELWSTGSFAKDPPNATVSTFNKDGSAVADTVVVLKRPKLEGERVTFDVAVLEGDPAKAEGPASVFIDTIWFGVGSGGLQYLGQNQTSGGMDPAVGSQYDTSTYSGWSNPAPNGYRQPASNYGNSLATPPELGGGNAYKPACGAPPLLPCY
jgi:hypothetical protein